MIQKDILYCGQRVTIACDGECHKAWGKNGRPRSMVVPEPIPVLVPVLASPASGFQAGPPLDPDDWFYYADHELPFAPKEVGSYEGEDTKPKVRSERLNKWCARECERCVMVKRDAPLELPDFNQRIYNIPRKRAES